ncbi:MAG: 3-phosphoshikimate 1-carboxyvinyltransferase [Coriobacteriia bacterium]|nr:3-phosphoshikimate 1-carboxyvinyltransferase [Coriobacteriia bacterium]
MSTDNITIIEPLAGPLDGSTRVPGDKSISHRAILFSAMAEGTTRVSGVLDSDDVRSSIKAVQKLGADVNLTKAIDGSLEGGITGWGSAGPKQPDEPIDCGNSGTTARLLMGVVAPWDIKVTLTGDESLTKRPMRRITAPLMKMGVNFEPAGRETLPITVLGDSSLHPIDYDAPMSSAQLKTAVLLAGLYADGTTTVSEPSPSRNHTELMLPEYGADTTAGYRTASVNGPCQLKACEVLVPGDPSSASFLVCAAVLKPGSNIQIENVSLNTARTGFVRTLERMGANIDTRITGYAGKEAYGIISAAYSPNLLGCEIPAQHIASEIDEIPVLAITAAFAKGITVFRGVGELKVKESNRLQAVIQVLNEIGIDAWEEGEDLFIQGQPGLKVPDGLVIDSRKDHRLAMTWSLLGLCGDKAIGIRDFDAVKVSFPTFRAQFEELVQK